MRTFVTAKYFLDSENTLLPESLQKRVAENKDKTNLSQTTTETGNGEIFSKKGSYSSFRTRDMEEYLNFLENFDDDRFEIVDISTSYHITSDGSDEFYMVTYRAKG